MVKTEINTFEQGDAELIKRYLPESPCVSCGAGIACCGCPKQREWDKKYAAPLKAAGVFNYADRYSRCKSSLEKRDAGIAF